MKAASAFLSGLALLGAMTAIAAASEQDGTVHVKSGYSVENTIERARRILEHQGIRVFGVIDHQEEARRMRKKLSPTQLLVFSVPESGVQIMRKNRISGIDFPMKLLVWEASNGTVWISYHRTDRLAVRYGFPADDQGFAKLGDMLEELAKAAAK